MEINKLDGDLEILVEYSEEPVIALRGEADFRNTARLRLAIRSLASGGKPSINVNLKELVFMDSTGVSALIDAAEAVTAEGGEVRLVFPSAHLIGVLAKSGFLEKFACEMPRETAPKSECVTAAAGDVAEFEVPGRPEMISHIRARAAEFAGALPFSPEEIEDIKLAVGEASANAVRHGASPNWCRVAVRMEKSRDALKISISDRGCGFDPSSVRDPDAGALTEGGRGIMFMRMLMDEVTFHPANPGTRVEMVKRVGGLPH